MMVVWMAPFLFLIPLLTHLLPETPFEVLRPLACFVETGFLLETGMGGAAGMGGDLGRGIRRGRGTCWTPAALVEDLETELPLSEDLRLTELPLSEDLEMPLVEDLRLTEPLRPSHPPESGTGAACLKSARSQSSAPEQPETSESPPLPVP